MASNSSALPIEPELSATSLSKTPRRYARIIKLVQQKSTPGATKLGSCLTDATRGGRARQTVRVFAAMLRSERATQQSSRPFDPVVSLRPPCPTGYSESLDQGVGLSSNQLARWREKSRSPCGGNRNNFGRTRFRRAPRATRIAPQEMRMFRSCDSVAS